MKKYKTDTNLKQKKSMGNKVHIIIILGVFGCIGLGVLLGWLNKKRKEEEEFRKWHDPIVMNPENFW